MSRPAVLANITRYAGESLEADRQAARIRDRLADAIRAAAELPGITQADLARAAGLSRQRVGQIVNET
jgi:DNA-binding XRE family transcriptional regulator